MQMQMLNANAKLNYLQKKIEVIFIILELEVRFFFVSIKFH